MAEDAHFRAAALRLGLKPRFGRRHQMFAVGGETDVEVAQVDEFKTGDAARKDSYMYVAGEHDPGDEVAVLLGEDILSMADIEFDLAHDAVRLPIFWSLMAPSMTTLL